MTAAELMRSRYSAFSSGGDQSARYLLHSWDPATRPHSLELDDDRTWRRLTIHETTKGGAFDQNGTVRFSAEYEDANGANTQTENSSFRRLDGRWVYTEAL